MTTPVTKAPPGHTPAEHHAPADSTYVLVFAFLVIVTAMEVSVTYIHSLRQHHVEVPLLIILMVIKFFTVTYYFMHLKFDPPTCRRVFNFGLFVAVGVYIAALAMFHFFSASFV
ncbi:MAG TPA: cytochrome C oxidase subunit IV family protein [Acidimicrobiales bacterium]|jgi:heme/copper-type cytochrome/quinol oxidase subunit 4|nr:cytochrome C oxidase subunit IV family protein [Acidimicrobiales bacterium]